MHRRISVCLVAAGLLLSPLIDGSGQDASLLGRRADHEIAAGRPAEALEMYKRAYRALSDPAFQLRFLNNIGACQLALFHYNEAAQTLLKARKLAEATHDATMLGSADGNLAAVFAQADDLAAAETYARESVEVYSRTDSYHYQARARMTLAGILSRRNLTPEGEGYFRAGIATATSLEEWASASDGWLNYGKILVESGRLEDADRAFAQSDSMLRKSARMCNEEAVLWNRSRLRLRQEDFKSALALINAAIRVSPAGGGRVPPWRLYQTRAAAELGAGDAFGALKDSRIALRWARSLRANIVPNNDNRVGIEGVLDEVFEVLIEAGNLVYLKTGDPKLVRETFEASEENRAESLDALLPRDRDWRVVLTTPDYRYKLSRLVAAQRENVTSGENQEQVRRLQTELSQMEAEAGATGHLETGAVLDRVRKNLPSNASLLSFRLGERNSWLWAVDGGKLSLYRLPPKPTIQAEIRELEAGIRTDDSDTISRVGRRLYTELFGGAGRPYALSPQWFISVDEPLYTLPFASLVVDVGKEGPVYLTERKAFELLPGAQMFASPQRGSLASRRFLLAGDGVYNHADPRYRRTGALYPVSLYPASWKLLRGSGIQRWSMARLPASGAEVKFAAGLWPHQSLLTGAGLTKENLLKEIDRDPDVIHIASHVIEGQDRWKSGILALGMERSGGPDLLTTKEIALHPIHSRLVVMTGCSSGSGEALPASGLMGLTRAWLAAGAGEVLATRWPTMDESRDGLIGRFYVHLLASRDGNIPEALRQARRDMISRGGWRAEPRYWSSFFLIGVR